MSTNTNTVVDNSCEFGLKSEIKRQVGLKNFTEKVCNYNQVHLVNSWKQLLKTGLNDVVSDLIWEYVLGLPCGLWVKNISSDVFGVYSKISIQIYNSQIGEKEDWEYVHVSSKEGKKRKLL